MSVEIPENIVAIINDKNTKKVLATVDKNGVPNVAFKGSIHVENGNIIVDELLETSQTSKNLIYALWFDKTVAISVWGENGSYEVKGVPYKVFVNGAEYEKAYIAALERNPINDLAGRWIIVPTEIRSQILSERTEEQRKKYPILGHLDKDRNEEYNPNK